MTDPLRVIQLTDCHISKEQGFIYRGINPRQTLAALLDGIGDWRPDLLLLTGDLAEDGSGEAYRYLAESLQILDTPVLVTPGNHDCPQRLAGYFQNTSVDDPLVHARRGWQIILLNSAVAGQVSGQLSERAVAGLRRCLSGASQPSIVVLHHQPVNVGSEWIDRHRLQQPEKLMFLLAGKNRVRAILWGHIHQAYERNRDGLLLLGAPASSANSLPDRVRFTFDPAGPACRWLKLHPGGKLETGILAITHE